MDLSALIFVPALVGSVIFGVVFLSFAAKYYLHVLESTAAGAKEVPWTAGNGLFDLTSVFYLAWLIGLWAGPAYLIGRAAVSGVGPAWLKLAAPLLVMWALYPVSQLASLSSSSIWVPMNLDVFARLAQKPLVTLGFFALTLPVAVLFGVAFKWAFLTRGEYPLLFAGVPLLVLATLLYARLLGRLAFALMFTKDLLKRKKKKRPKRITRGPVAADPEEAPAATQPSLLPPINTPDGELAGYNVLIADDPPAPKKRVTAQIVDDTEEPEGAPVAPRSRKARPEESPPVPRARKPARPAPAFEPTRTWTDDDDDATPYEMNPADGTGPEKPLIPDELLKPKAEEMALLDRRNVPKPPKHVWSAKLLAFLGQPGTLSALLVMSASGTLAGVMVRVARAFDPTFGAE